MKKVVSGLFAILFAFTLQAGTIKVIEGNSKIAGSRNSVLTVVIYETDFEEVIKAWKKKMKSTKVKVKTSKGEVFADNAVIKKLGDHSMDIYARTEKIVGGSKLIVGVNLGGVFLNSRDHKDKYDSFARFVEEFAESQIRASIIEQIKDAEKELKRRVKAQEYLVKHKESLKNKIVGYKNDIKEAELKISTNESKQVTQKKKIEAQKIEVESVKAKEAKFL
jgi:hypothetical protein